MAESRNTSKYHGTKCELQFLEKLGTRKFHVSVTTPRIELLKKYRASMSLRKRWGSIKKEALVGYLNKEIARLGG